MTLVLTTVIPFFLIVGLGWFAGRRGLIPQSAVGPFNTFVFRFAMPALVIRLLWSTDSASIVDPAFLSGWLVAGILLFGTGGLGAGLAFGHDFGRFAIRGQSCSVANVGFFGFPITLAVFGEAAAGPLGMALMIDLMVMIPVSIALLEAARGKASSPGAVAIRALSGSVRNPFFLSIAIGAALSIAQLPQPASVTAFLTFLGGAAGPAGLFALGLYLAGNPGIERPAEASFITGVKLLVHPILVWWVLGTLFDISGTALAVAVVIAGLPVAANVFVIAREYETAPKLASDSILLSTFAAVVTVSAATAFLAG